MSSPTGRAHRSSRRARLGDRIDELLALRMQAGERYFEELADPLARLCHRTAERFSRGGRLLALASTPQARSDAHHVAVEFVHPVIVGKRALPALALTGTGEVLRERVELTAEPADIAIGFGSDTATAVAVALAAAARHGALTVAFAPIGAECEFVPAIGDPFVSQELIETAYHIVWELVHVFFEHRGLLAGRDGARVHDAGASSFLYPFLAEREDDLERVLDDVRSSIRLKAEETALLRAQTLAEGRETLIAAGIELRERLDAGGTLFALGNGGSATDAMDVVADLREPPGRLPARRAIDLTEDAAILTAIANDIGVEAIFRRQVIAHCHEGDALLAISTSGGSANVIEALVEARRRGVFTLAMTGYDGGPIAASSLADQILLTRSQHIPRIQEAQASAWHVLRELVETAG